MVHILKAQHCRRGMGYGRNKIGRKVEMQKHDVRGGVSPRLNEEGDQTEATISVRAPVCVNVCPRPLQGRKNEDSLASKQEKQAQ